MKKLLILTNLVWLSFFVFTGFKPMQTSQPKPKQGRVAQKPTDLTPKPKTCKAFCNDYSSATFGGLPLRTAIKMANNYKVTVSDPTQARSVWFSLETIKKFVYQIDKSVCGKNCKALDKNNLGIRIYFAKYPTAADSDFPFLTTTPQFYGKNTVMMVPTYYDPATPTMGDVDFDPLWATKPATYKCKPLTIKNMREPTPSLPAPLPTTLTIVGMPDPNGMQNHGGLCPPVNCPGMAF